jgi:hypothetical protein
MLVLGRGLLHRLGMAEHQLLQSEVCVSTADQKSMDILGTLILELGLMSGAKSLQFGYVTDSTDPLFIPRDALQDLEINPKVFPGGGGEVLVAEVT